MKIGIIRSNPPIENAKSRKMRKIQTKGIGKNKDPASTLLEQNAQAICRSFFEHVVTVEAADVANCHGDLAHAPPACAHLPVAGAIVEGLLGDRSWVTDVPATSAEVSHCPSDGDALGLGPLAQGCNDLVTELNDLQGVA